MYDGRCFIGEQKKEADAEEGKKRLAIIHCDQNVDVIIAFQRALALNFVRRARGDFNSLFGSANSLRAKTIMRLFDSKWIVEKRFSSFLADVPASNSPKTFWARVCPIYT